MNDLNIKPAKNLIYSTPKFYFRLMLKTLVENSEIAPCATPVIPE